MLVLGTLERNFNLAELRELAFGLRVDWDNLPGDTLSLKAMALIEWCEHRGRLKELRMAITAARPGVLV